MPVGARVIDCPVPFGPDPPADARIAQAGAGPLGLSLPVRRKRKILVLKAWILLERSLRTQYTPCAEAGYDQQEQRAEPHFSVSIILQFAVALLALLISSRIASLRSGRARGFWRFRCERMGPCPIG